MKLKQIFRKMFVVAVAIAACSCSSIEDKVELVDCENVSIKGTSGASADLIFNNESFYKITVLEGAVLSLYDNSKLLISVKLNHDIVIPKRSESAVVPSVWRLEDANLLQILGLTSRIKSQSLDGLTVGVVGTAKAGLFKRKVSERGIPLRALISSIE